MLVARRRRRAPRARLRTSGRASGRRVKSDATARRPFVSTSRADSDDETRVARRRPRSPSALVQSRWGRDDDVGCGRKARVKVILQKAKREKLLAHLSVKSSGRVTPAKKASLNFTDVDEADHCETPFRAYRDVEPFLFALAKALKRTKAQRVYDRIIAKAQWWRISTRWDLRACTTRMKIFTSAWRRRRRRSLTSW